MYRHREPDFSGNMSQIIKEVSDSGTRETDDILVMGKWTSRLLCFRQHCKHNLYKPGRRESAYD